jgi:hypothetical protein
MLASVQGRNRARCLSDSQKPAPPPNCRTMVSARLKLWRPLRLPMQADTLNNGCDGIVNKSEFKSFA